MKRDIKKHHDNVTIIPIDRAERGKAIRKSFTIYVDPNLMEEVKHYQVTRQYQESSRIGLGVILEEALREYLDKQP